jgi:hypothetical protein
MKDTFKKKNHRPGTALKKWERAERYFEAAQEAIRVPHYTSTKYLVMKFKDAKEDLVFIGAAGAIRVGHNATNSLSVTDYLWPKIEKWEKQRGFYDKAE